MIEVLRQAAHVSPTALDRAIEWLAPGWGVKRRTWRMKLAVAEGLRGRFSPTPSRRTERLESSLGTGPIYGRNQLMLRGNAVKRSGELYLYNNIAQGIVGRMVDNIVGRGIRPQARSADAGWNRQAEDLWEAWAEEGADVKRRIGGLYGVIQPLLCSGRLVDGDVLLHLLDDGELQLVEGTRIETPPQKAGLDRTFDGVETDRAGRPLRYWVRDDDLGYSHTAVPARRGIYLARRMFENDVRGWPIFTAGDGLYDQVDASVEAVVVAAQMAAMFGLVVVNETGTPPAGLEEVQDARGVSRPAQDMEPGMWKYLAPGEDIRQVSPAHPSQNYPDFLTAVCRYIGLPAGAPLEILMLDFSRTNYSSARAAILQWKKAIQREQALLIYVMRRVWRWRISRWMNEDKLPRREDAFRHVQIAPGFEMLDLQKEIGAYSEAIDRGLMSRTQVNAAQGEDNESVLEQLAMEQERMEALGISVVYSGKTRDAGGGATQETGSDDDDDSADE